MLDLKIFLNSLWQKARNFLQGRFSYRGSKRKHKKLSFSFDMSTSSFATMEVSGQFKQVFKFIDSNGDGKISPVELSELLFCLGYEKLEATKEAEGMVKEMDSNRDGYIDLDEFMDVVNAGDAEEDYIKDAFLIFDSDKNGKISAKELQKVLNSLGRERCSIEECKLMIKGVDKDGDGFVDFEEFRMMMMIVSKN